MDPALWKALAGAGALTALAAVIVGSLNAFTARTANRIAERRLLLESDEKQLKEQREWREELRQERADFVSRCKELQDAHDEMREERDTALRDLALRERACVRIGTPCLIQIASPPARGMPPQET